MLAGIAVLWLLNVILPKTEVGFCLLSLMFVTLVGVVIGMPFQKLIVFYLSRAAQPADASMQDIAGPPAGKLLTVPLVLAIIAALGIALASDAVSDAIAKPGMAIWLSAMAISLPFTVLRDFLTAVLSARQDIGMASMFGHAFPAVGRALGLGMLALAGVSNPWGIALVFGLAQLFTCVPMIRRSRIFPMPFSGTFGSWDWGYCASIAFTQLCIQPSRTIDAFFVGTMLPSTAVADYMLANRFASLALLPKQALGSLQTPRIGNHLSKGDTTLLQHEYDQTRWLALLIALAGAVIMLLFAGWFLSLFGNYAGAVSILTILYAAMLVRIGTGNSGEYLNMAGYGGRVLTITLVSLAVTVVAMLVLVPVLGARGAAGSVLLGAIVGNGLLAAAIRWTDQLGTLDSFTLLTICMSVLTLILVSANIIDSRFGALLIGLITGAGVMKKRATFTLLSKPREIAI